MLHGSRLVVLAVAVLKLSLHGQETAPLTPAAYLLRPIGSRALSLAGMQVACADEPSALFSNPALLAYTMDSITVGGGISTFSYGRTVSHLGIVVPNAGMLSLGAGISGYTAGVLTRRTQSGTALGATTVWQGSLALSASYAFSSFSSIGIAGRTHFASAPDPASNGSGISVDIGYVSTVFDVATLGIAVQNLGFMKIGTEQFSLPWIVRIGACTVIPFHEAQLVTTSPTLGTADTTLLPSRERLLLGLEVQMRAGSHSPSVIAGIEVIPLPLIVFRAGLSVFGESNTSLRFLPGTAFGAGIGIYLPTDLPLRIDYALSNSYTTTVIHTVSLIVWP